MLITHTVPDAELNRIYNQAYCGVLPTRGEAWSLFPCQLAATKTPTITTAFSGHLHYLNFHNSYLISLDGFGPIMDGEPCSVDFYNHVPFAIPDVEHLRSLLQFTYSHPDDVQRRGELAYRAVIPRYTWDTAADTVLKRIEQICRRL